MQFESSDGTFKVTQTARGRVRLEPRASGFSPWVSTLPDIPWSSTKELTLDTESSTPFLKTDLLHLETQKNTLYCIN